MQLTSDDQLVVLAYESGLVRPGGGRWPLRATRKGVARRSSAARGGTP